MKRKKQFGTINNINNDTITIKIDDSFSKTPGKATARGIVGAYSPAQSQVSLYRKSSQSKRGVLGIKYTPSYYVGKAQIKKTDKPNQYLIEGNHISGSKLNIGDTIIVETAISKKK